MIDARSLEADSPPSWLKRRQVQPMPDRLRTAVELVLLDLQGPRTVELRLAYVRDSDGPVVWVWEVDGSGAAGFGLGEWEESDTALIVRFADWLQEQVFPETSAAWGEARPECPGHPHPAAAVECDGEPWWVCPATGRRIEMIGRMD